MHVRLKESIRAPSQAYLLRPAFSFTNRINCTLWTTGQRRVGLTEVLCSLGDTLQKRIPTLFSAFIHVIQLVTVGWRCAVASAYFQPLAMVALPEVVVASSDTGEQWLMFALHVQRNWTPSSCIPSYWVFTLGSSQRWCQWDSGMVKVLAQKDGMLTRQSLLLPLQ